MNTSRESAEKLYGFLSDRAKQHLRSIDPVFVEKMEEMVRFGELNLTHPAIAQGEIPPPSTRLPKRWHRLLEATHDVYGTADRFDLAAESFHVLEGDTQIVGRNLSALGYDWHVWGYAVLAKLRRVSLIAVGVLGRGDPDDVRTDRRRHILAEFERVLGVVASKSQRVRDPALHGEGGTRGKKDTFSPISRGITEANVWESGVAIGLGAHAAYDSNFESLGAERKPYWQEAFKEMTRIHIEGQLAFVEASIGLLS